MARTFLGHQSKLPTRHDAHLQYSYTKYVSLNLNYFQLIVKPPIIVQLICDFSWILRQSIFVNYFVRLIRIFFTYLIKDVCTQNWYLSSKRNPFYKVHSLESDANCER
jgi:hypothetical protein